MSRITINGISFDPAAPTPASTMAESIDVSRSNYILIQTKGPLADDDKSKLASLGVEIQEYVSENTYLCGYKPSDLGAVRALPFVSWAGTYLKGFKVGPSLRPPVSTATMNAIVPEAAAPSVSTTPRQVDIVLHDDVNPDTTEIKAKIAAAAHVSPDTLTVSRKKIRLNVQERFLNNVAAIDEVRHLEEVPGVKLYNNVARGIIVADVSVNGTTFQGDGQVVVVNDTGFDQGSINNPHPAFAGRVLSLVPIGRSGDASDPAGHGTHVCGSVLGDGNSASMGGAIQGTAPKAKLVVQSLLDAGGGLAVPDDLHDLFQPPYDGDPSARVHTNSWGATTPGLPYNQSSQEIDDFVWNHQDCVICFAAGNDGIDSNGDGRIDTGSIGSQAAAKNCITVGATESLRPDIDVTYGQLRPTSFPSSPIFGDQSANNADGMAAFSSRGPTKEKRLKPDVVAPGTSILSTRSRAVVSPDVIFGTSNDPDYFFDDGTSMATPLVAGCCAVLRETLVKNNVANPSAALIKALLINGARPIPGQYNPSEAGPSPNPASGWGRVNLAGSVIMPGDANGGFGEGGPLKQGQRSGGTIRIPPSVGPAAVADASGNTVPAGIRRTLKFTLAWTDPPGAQLQNDLDLIIKATNGQERHGNMGTGAEFDRLNNVEQIVWENVPSGDLTFEIAAFHITRFPQPYAFAWRIS
jgi:serine protease AprX